MKESTINKYKLVIEAYYQNGMNGFKAVEAVYGKKTERATKLTWNRIDKEMRTNENLIKHSETFKKKLQDSFSHDELLLILRSWLESDLTEAIALSPQEIKELPESFRKLITGYKHSKTIFDGGEKESFELKFADKIRAAEMIAKHIGFYKEQPQGGTNNTQININFI